MPGTDINSYINRQWDINSDPEGRLAELEPWSEERALELAHQESIEMSEEHWDVIHFLRERYLQEGQARSGRKVVEALERRYAGKGGKRYLYTLFPHGPVTQASIIAGLPLPAYTTDPSFGSSE
ncbi:MAG: TusE/DsrC/DsvC family sulfur relay protein [Gammaproteobacteria bacterium]|nr:TusE/DsrC/DsvC family sulfur relay protein [Gammaproteobacteria bacterium]MCW8927381.1 TusE/DsrC/DsvC family sulfur relay protein [Gammaproteobacteria bacterium]MCW8973676.1 TusE/DsrC/DsvC family sulfur relay protein [Gammaproteobacteria bacterium]MCW8992473.1 TusE/DsrC/DsvC family sulfur relay protein [Gammaproteobacteria bacterium]MCW9088345.1 TusE/DsrC/DsvC family sulfur relay protein [Gammaproteobacteria bacterium]